MRRIMPVALSAVVVLLTLLAACSDDDNPTAPTWGQCPLAVPEHYDTIQAAMDAAAPGDTVFVAPGTYTDANEYEIVEGWTMTAVVIMKPGVTLLGRPEAPESVIIQGTPTTVGIYCQEVDSTAVITGLTVTGARSGIGGRLASPMISHCRLVANVPESTFSSGGGLYGDDFSPSISDCLFADNVATSGGGATFANESFPVLRRCEFRNNQALASIHNPGHGGALVVTQESSALLIDCSLTGNLASADAGACLVKEAELRLENVTVTGNESGERGGAFYLHYEVDLQLVGCTVSGNVAGVEGGGVFTRADAVTTVEGGSWRQNTAPAGADGFLLRDSWPSTSVTLICCDADPVAWEGDGLVVDDSDCD